jgi:hypothetical protein
VVELNKTCARCGATETSKWFTGPMCRKCYRAQPHVKEIEKQSRLKRIDHYRQVAKQYQNDNQLSVSAKNKKWYESNKKAVALLKKAYKSNNREKISAYEKDYSLSRRLKDKEFKIRCNLRSRLSKALKGIGKESSFKEYIGCSIEELKKHLESQFQPNMSWDNYGKYGWHIDHIKPLASFDLTDPDEFKKACHYTNLQPLWAKDNLSKGAKEVS